MAKFLRNYWLSVLMGLTNILWLVMVILYRQDNSSLLQEVEIHHAEMYRIHVNMEICVESLTDALEERDAQREKIKELSEEITELRVPPKRSQKDQDLIKKLAEEFKYSQGNVDWKKLLQPADQPEHAKGNATVSKLPSFRPTFSTALIDIGVAHCFKGKGRFPLHGRRPIFLVYQISLKVL